MSENLKELEAKNKQLKEDLDKAHWAVAVLLLKIVDDRGIIGLIELPDKRVYSLPVEILIEVKQILKDNE